jgi:hypothetical protein
MTEIGLRDKSDEYRDSTFWAEINVTTTNGDVMNQEETKFQIMRNHGVPNIETYQAQGKRLIIREVDVEPTVRKTN